MSKHPLSYALSLRSDGNNSYPQVAYCRLSSTYSINQNQKTMPRHSLFYILFRPLAQKEDAGMPTHKALSFHGASRRYKRLPHTKRRCARLLGTPSIVCLLAIASPTLACGRGDGKLFAQDVVDYKTHLALYIVLFWNM